MPARSSHLELDELRSLAKSGKDWVANLQKTEAEKTGISSLKVGFNKVFGYYLEVTHTHKEKVPEGWIRKQTLVNSERYITEELKEYEEKILTAEDPVEYEIDEAARTARPVWSSEIPGEERVVTAVVRDAGTIERWSGTLEPVAETDDDDLAGNVNAAALAIRHPDYRPIQGFNVPKKAEHHWRGIRARVACFGDVRAAAVDSGENPAHVLANTPERYAHVNKEPARCLLPDVEDTSSNPRFPPPSRKNRSQRGSD